MINTDFESKLQALKIPGRIVNIADNDFYTCYYVDFMPDITLNKIKARRDDIALFFSCSSVEIETDAGAVVIKVEKNRRDTVLLNNYLYDVKMHNVPDCEIPLIIGQTEDGNRLYYDLCKMPHLLAGGSTGSGKSVFMHNCILSTIASGKSLIVMIDVKRVEFSIYENIPHLCAPICYDARTARDTLKKLCNVMDIRYNTLKSSNARNIKEYNENGGDMQYITVFIDELADLMMANNQIEFYLVRLAQLGRAAGIHLVVATQRPDSQILSGLIRVNIPTRVCFAVQKATDSRIILDMPGGEKLRGAGDGLFVPIGSKDAIHFQAPYISTPDLLGQVDLAKHCND